jgi:hypothetical protein
LIRPPGRDWDVVPADVAPPSRIAPAPETTIPLACEPNATRSTRHVVTLVAIVAVALTTACSDAPTTADASGPAPAASGGLLDDGGLPGTGIGSGLLRCTPMPPVHVEAVIGPDGGVLQAGPHSLVVPPGARTTVIGTEPIFPSM